MRLLQIALLLSFLAISTSPISAQCKSLKTLKTEYADIIKPYDFEGISAGVLGAGKTTNISVSVFSKVKYRFHFYSEGYDGPVIVKIITLNHQVLWTNEKDPGNMMAEFTPKKTDKYFVEYTTPSSANDDSRGCIALILSSRPY
jgi:hypothetical protein